MPPEPSPELQAIIVQGLLPAVAALDRVGIPHTLVGSLGAWVYGAPEPSRDVDLVIAPTDLAAAAAALHAAGLDIQLTPGDGDWEWWFFRAWVRTPGREFPVEIIYAPSLPAADVINRGKRISVGGRELQVAALTDILALKLAGLREQHPNGSPDQLDFVPLLQMARTVAGQLDWVELRALTSGSPYAAAFLQLASALGLEHSVGPENPDCYVTEQRQRMAALQPVVSALALRYPARNNYELLGPEYYDVVRHPTCAEFRLASKVLIAPLLPTVLTGEIVEVGAGDSLLAELLSEQGKTLEHLTITDAYPAMLTHSQRWRELGARIVLAPADALPVGDSEVGLLLASLGDAYNEPGFWSEVARVLAPGGVVLYTTPAYRWVWLLRAGAHSARLALGDLASVAVPSVVYPEEKQQCLVEEAGLTVLSVTHFWRREMPEPTSDALHCLNADDPVITCFQCQRVAVPPPGEDGLPAAFDA